MPNLAASPDLERTWSSYPCGSATLMPVGRTSICRGLIVTRLLPPYAMSYPAEPGVALTSLDAFGLSLRREYPIVIT